VWSSWSDPFVSPPSLEHPPLTDIIFTLSPPDGLARALTIQVRGGEVLVVDDEPTGDALYLGALGDIACWAVDADGDGEIDGLLPLMALHGRVDEARWTLAGRAVQLVEWARTHRYCGRCGTATEVMDRERARRCPACGLLAFPRLAPAVITLIHRGDEVLLARGRAFPIPMYSCLAGFVEPGEDLEQAVRREVGEEVGVTLGQLRYFASQPWPFPHSLMIGFTAEWASGDIVIDEDEIVDAQWYTADAMPTIPPGLSIARTLIDAWLAGEVR
jgi:NAD+ diphosphatase